MVEEEEEEEDDDGDGDDDDEASFDLCALSTFTIMLDPRPLRIASDFSLFAHSGNALVGLVPTNINQRLAADLLGAADVLLLAAADTQEHFFER